MYEDEVEEKVPTLYALYTPSGELSCTSAIRVASKSPNGIWRRRPFGGGFEERIDNRDTLCTGGTNDEDEFLSRGHDDLVGRWPY